MSLEKFSERGARQCVVRDRKSNLLLTKATRIWRRLCVLSAALVSRIRLHDRRLPLFCTALADPSHVPLVAGKREVHCPYTARTLRALAAKTGLGINGGVGGDVRVLPCGLLAWVAHAPPPPTTTAAPSVERSPFRDFYKEKHQVSRDW